jgi:pyridoxal phosphate enzyme (YggS family)
MSIINNFNFIKEKISSLNCGVTEVIAVSKTFSLVKIMPLIEIGHIHFGENKVQEAKQKWSGILSENKSINLHLLGKLQSNKAKEAFKIFNFIHTLDNCKLAKILSSLEKDNVRKINYFVQVNIGNEIQKNGIDYNLATEFIKYCRFDLLLNIIGLMCIPPLGHSSSSYFKKCKELADLNNLKELSMGMSNDYIEAVKNGSTFVRIGNAIFGERFT